MTATLVVCCWKPSLTGRLTSYLVTYSQTRASIALNIVFRPVDFVEGSSYSTKARSIYSPQTSPFYWGGVQSLHTSFTFVYFTKTDISLPYYLLLGREEGIYAFHKGIKVKWNTICLVQDLNSAHRYHFLQR